MSDPRIPSFSVTTRDSGVVVVHMQGDLDAHGAREVEPGLGMAFPNRNQHAIIDLSRVEYMSSAGLALLASHALALRRGGGSLSVSGAIGTVADVIRQSGFGEVMTLYSTLDEAILEVEKALRGRSAPTMDAG